eukprot:m.559741 g.559741  ORF g.559741 m.559741 type:complete len:388 (+) comp57778_c0_seq3:136-1299(+)
MVLPAHGMRTLAAQAIRLSGSARRLFGQRAPLSVSAAPPLVQAFAPIMSADTAVLRNSLLAGDRAALARAITLMESRRPDKRDQGQALLFDVANSNRTQTRETFRVALTGPPGAGKSTFIEALGTYLTSLDQCVAVLTVDPSSSISGGSILGDKTRMVELSRNPKAYVRPSPSSGVLGGVARNTCDSIVLCEAAGFNVVLVETVGVGQSETSVADMVDMFVLVVPPAGGDELQGIKRGIVELVDMIIINKADGDLVVPARRAKIEYTSALKLLSRPGRHWNPQVLSASSLTRDGVVEVWNTMTQFQKESRASGYLQSNRERQALAWLWSHINERVLEEFTRHPTVSQHLPDVQKAVRDGAVTPGIGADFLFRVLRNASKPESNEQQK